MKKINFKLILIFIISVIFIFICLNLFYNNIVGDPMSEYAMAHAFTHGQIPYIDYNTVVPPGFVMFYSIFLFIYDDFITMLIVTSILIFIMAFLLYKLLGIKWLIIPAISSISLFINYFPTYNLLSFFLIILAIYLESIEFKNKDYIIGIILGLLLFTKQTIGFTVILLNYIYLKDFIKIKKRTISILGICLLFLIYFILNHNLYNFIDLCFLGLLDFTKNTSYYSVLFIVIFISITIFLIYKIIKTKNFIYYYALGGIAFSIPIIDIVHLNYYFTLAVISFLYNFNLKERYKTIFKVFSIIYFILIFGVNCEIRKNMYGGMTTINLNHYKYQMVSKETKDYMYELNNEYKKYKNVIMVSGEAPFIATVNDKKMNFLNFFYEGNFGHNGDKKLIEKIKQSKDTYYYIYQPDSKKHNQFNRDIENAIIKDSKYIKDFYRYKIYYKK